MRGPVYRGINNDMYLKEKILQSIHLKTQIILYKIKDGKYV